MSRPTKNVLVAMFAILLIACLPMLSVWLATGIASSLGCQLDEAGVHPCQLHGVELGETLYQMDTLGWIGIAAMPLAIGAIGVLLVCWIIAAIYRRLKGRDSTV